MFAAPTGKSSELNHKSQIINIINDFNLTISKHDTNILASSLIDVSRTKACKVSWDILLSIAINESSLNRFAYNKRTHDYGLMQFNDKTIDRMGLNKVRIAQDIHYSLVAACDLLSSNKALYGRPGRHYRSYWIGNYNAGINFGKPGVINRAKAYDLKIKGTIKQIKAKYVKLNMYNNTLAKR